MLCARLAVGFMAAGPLQPARPRNDQKRREYRESAEEPGVPKNTVNARNGLNAGAS